MSGKHRIPDGPGDCRRDAIPAAQLVYARTGFRPDRLMSTCHDGTQRREAHLAVVR